MDEQRFKTFKIFLYLAQFLKDINPMFSYYLKVLGVKRACEVLKGMNGKSDSNYEILQRSVKTWLSEVELQQAQNKSLFASKEENLQEITLFISHLFFQTDDRERQGEISFEIQEMFLLCLKLIETVESDIFNHKDSSYQEKKTYCKYKAIQIQKQLGSTKPDINVPQKKQTVSKMVEENADNNFQQLKLSSHQPEIKQKTNSLSQFQQPQKSLPQSNISHKFNPQNQQLSASYNLNSRNANYNEIIVEENNTQQQYNSESQLGSLILFDDVDEDPRVQITQQAQQMNIKMTASANIPQTLVSQNKIRNKVSDIEITNIKQLLKNAISELDFKNYNKAEEVISLSLQKIKKLNQQ